MKPLRDLIIVGSGPAGVAAAFQARRDGWDALLIGNEPPGGLSGAARKIENLFMLPGPMSGAEFQIRLRRQLDDAAIERTEDTVLDCRRENGGFVVTAARVGEIACRALLLACGTEPATFPLPGLQAAAETGVLHRDIRTLPASLTDDRVIVIGGGEAAVDSALWVRDRGGKATICVRKDRIVVRSGLKRELCRSSIAVRFGLEPAFVNITGGGLMVGMKGPSGLYRLEGRHLLLCIGRRSRLSLYRKLGGMGIPREGITDIPGLYLAGDVLRDRNRFIAPALDDGIRAAAKAGRYLTESSSEKRS